MKIKALIFFIAAFLSGMNLSAQIIKGSAPLFFAEKAHMDAFTPNLPYGSELAVVLADTTLYRWSRAASAWTKLTTTKVYPIATAADTSTIVAPYEGDLAYVDTAQIFIRDHLAWLRFVGGNAVDTNIIASRHYVDSLRQVVYDSLGNVVLYANMPVRLNLPSCTSTMPVLISGMVQDPAISVASDLSGDITVAGAAGLAVTYIQEQEGFAYFEVQGTLGAGVYAPMIEYVPSGISLSGLFDVAAGRADTVTVFDPPGQDRIWVVRVCGVEISRDTISTPIETLKKDVELNDRRIVIRGDERYNSAPSFFKTRNGTLITAYRRCKGHTGDGDAIVSRSENGVAWEHNMLLENADPVEIGAYETVIADFSTDTLHFFTRFSNDTTATGILDTAILIHSISVDDGSTFSVVDTLPMFFEVQIVGPAKGVVYEERRMIPFYAIAGIGTTSYVAGVMYTDDYGATWDTSMFSQDTLLKLDETELLIVGDTVIAFTRSEDASVQEQLFRTYSVNGGNTWSTPELVIINDWRRSHPGVILLPNGNMLLNGRRLSSPTRRPTLWQSSDNGRNWTTIGEIDSIGYSNYGSFAMLNADKVGLVYSVDNRYDGTSSTRSALKFAAFDVPSSTIFSGGEKVQETEFTFDDPVRNQELWYSTRHYFDENITITVCKDSCDYPSINQAWAYAETLIPQFDSTATTGVSVTIDISRNEDGTAFSFSTGLPIPPGDWYPITITSGGDSVIYTGSGAAFRQYSRGMSPKFINLRLYDQGTGTAGIEIYGANSYLDQLVIDGFGTGVTLGEGNHFLYRSTIKNSTTGLNLSRGYGYIRQDSIYSCATGVVATGGFTEFRDMRVLNNTTSVSGFLGAIFSFNNGTQQFWANGSTPTSADFTFNANGGAIYRNPNSGSGGTAIPRNTWVNGNYIGGEVELLVVVEDSTSITIDLESLPSKVAQIDMTGVSNAGTITLQEPLNPAIPGVYTFHFRNVVAGGPYDVDYPATFLNAAGAALDGSTTVEYAADDFFTCYYDGTNYHCK